MNSNNRLGVVTIAVGSSRYKMQAETLIRSFRRHMPNIPVSVVSDDDRLVKLGIDVIPIDYSLPIATAQKLLLDRYSPFHETLFIDSDCIVSRPFHQELAAVRAYEFTPVLERMVRPEEGDEYVEDLRFAVAMTGGTLFPKFNGGVYFFRKSALSASIFHSARQFFFEYRALGIRQFDRGGCGDETVLALAMSKHGCLDLYSDGGRLMRTPTGLIGQIAIEPLGGGCSFYRQGEGKVEPAICHFAGPFLDRPEYALAEVSLRSNIPIRDLPANLRLRAYFLARVKQCRRFVKYRRDGVAKRIQRFRGALGSETA